MSRVQLILLISLLVNIVFGQYFQTNSHTFLQKVNNTWVDFGKFAAVNLGVTKPGYLPGEIILTSENYLRRFRRLEQLGVKVIRVYALLHPDFYKTLVEWNEKHVNKIYVLHGTAFPEYEMEANNGTDAFNDTISVPMKHFINKTAAGVYGQGKVVYKYEQGIYPITKNYKYNIAQYLLGWVVAGEMSPYCVYATNTAHPNKLIYNGKYISSVENASAFEVWMADNMDYLAQLISSYNHSTPISWTNWATTDGIKNPVEPPYIGDVMKSSIEDWQEIDLHNFDFSAWEAGSFYNQHAYPYYPQFITLLNDLNGDEKDPYMEYITRLSNYYNDLPFIITEVGLSTTYGVASYDNSYGRNQGHITEVQQGILLRDIMLGVIKEVNISGVVIFQLQDEWFKKTWNTLKFEPNEKDGSGRNYWMNALSAEQGFGIFRSEPSQNMNSNSYGENDYLKDIKISNDERFVKLNFKVKTNDDGDKIVIGINSVAYGANQVFNLNIEKTFKEYIDYLFEINIKTKEVKFYVTGCHDYFRTAFGQWLVDLTNNYNYTENFAMKYSAYNLSKCNNNIFQSYLLLVKAPAFKVRSGEYIYVPHTHLEIEFRDDNDNLSLLKLNNNNEYTLLIPYNLIAFSNPSLKKNYVVHGYGKNLKIGYLNDHTDVDFEISVFSNDGVEFIELRDSIMNLKYNWDPWDIPICYRVSAKHSFNYFRQAFSAINGYVKGNLTDKEIANLDYISCPNDDDISIHKYIVIASFLFLSLCFLWAGMYQRILAKCYIAERRQQSWLATINLMFFIICATVGIVYYFDEIPIDIVITKPEFTWKYCSYILIIIWDALIIFLFMFLRCGSAWNLNEKKEYNLHEEEEKGIQLLNDINENEHAFIIACHNSADVIESTLESLLQKVPPESIYVADNGSTSDQQKLTNDFCYYQTKKYYKNRNEEFDPNRVVNYGHMTINGRGNKTIAQYLSVCHIMKTNKHVKYVTCIDDDTRLHQTWEVSKVIRYFKNDSNIGVLAYPLKADKPQYDIELYQSLEYLIVGYVKICHSNKNYGGLIFNSTIFNSGAFGTYRIDILCEAFQYHNTEFHGDDLQICLHMHQLKNKQFITQQNRIHDINYRVVAATNMVVSTIVPKCPLHLKSFSRQLFPNEECKCMNPDLFGQRSKGWFLSKHRFIPKYFKFIFNCCSCRKVKGCKGIGFKGIWVRIIAAYELLIILNEYALPFYIAYLIVTHYTFNLSWLLEGFIIATAFNVFVMMMFNYFVLRPNQLNLPFESITVQPFVYKIFMVTFYRYMGLLYHALIYAPTNCGSANTIQDMDEVEQLKEEMYAPKGRPRKLTINDATQIQNIGQWKAAEIEKIKERIKQEFMDELSRSNNISHSRIRKMTFEDVTDLNRLKSSGKPIDLNKYENKEEEDDQYANGMDEDKERVVRRSKTVPIGNKYISMEKISSPRDKYFPLPDKSQ